MKVQNYAAPLLVVGCILFSLGSLIVKFVPVGSYAIAFWRLLIATVVFWALMKWKKQALPMQAKTWWFAALSGIFLAFDLAFWHENLCGWTRDFYVAEQLADFLFGGHWLLFLCGKTEQNAAIQPCVGGDWCCVDCQSRIGSQP